MGDNWSPYWLEQACHWKFFPAGHRPSFCPYLIRVSDLICRLGISLGLCSSLCGVMAAGGMFGLSVTRTQGVHRAPDIACCLSFHPAERHPRHWGFSVFAPGAEEVGVPCLETSACRGAPLHVPAVICQALNFSVNRKGPQEANQHSRFQRLRRLGCPAPG